jgi:hypothetical protein
MNYFLLSALFLCPLLHAQDSGSIEGSVVDNLTGAGISDVTVYFGSDQSEHYDAVTDADGRFRISGIKNGQYGSHFEKTGYITQYSGTNDSVLKTVRIFAGQDPVRLRIELVGYATVRGRVLDPEGKPVAKSTVRLGLLATETTDGQGEFAFAKLSPGSYKLQASPNSEASSPPAPGEDRTEIVPTWFPSAIDSDLAEHILVHGGADLSGYEIRLRATPVYRVRGVVRAENGKPALHAVVSNAPDSERVFGFGLFNIGDRKGANRQTTMSAGPLGYFMVTRSGTAFSPGRGLGVKEGVFEFPSVPRGTRQFAAWIEPEDGEIVPVTAGVSAVVDRDIDDLQLRFAAPLTMEGSVELSGATGPSIPQLVRRAFVALNFVSLAGRLSATPVADGSLRFENVVPGPYRILAAPGLPGGYYLASISLGGQDVMGQSVDLEPGSPPIHVVYKPNAGTVSGTVDTEEGATVVLIPQASLDSLSVDFGRMSQSGTGGAFEIESVGPGSYYAFAVDRLDPAKFYEPQVVRKIVSSAALVQVAEGSVVSVKLKNTRLEQ